MKTTVLALLAVVSSFLNLIAQEQVLADLNIKLGAASDEEYYFGFAEGDKIILDFSEEKGKGITEIEITEYPKRSIFADFKPIKIEGKEIEGNNTGIYKFRFKNSALAAKICAIKIRRAPGEGNEKFNTKVSWKTIYDTSYLVTKEQYIVKDEYKTVVIQAPQQSWINSGRNAMFQGGHSRIGFEVTLPPNTVEWYYVFSASRNKESMERTSKSFDLLGKLSRLIDQTGVVDFAVSSLGTPPGDDYCEIYLLDYTNYTAFLNKTEFRYMIEGTRENLKSGTVKIKQSCLQGTWYLGIKNPSDGQGIAVGIEVVAIVHNKEYGTRDKKTPIINKHKEPYLSN